MISVSIVSHGHGALLHPLMADLVDIARVTEIEIILTNNIPDPNAPSHIPDGLPGRLIYNSKPLGFGHNHNNAFALASGDLFCVLNPDIRFPDNPFPLLRDALCSAAVGVVAPAILSPAGRIEDSARTFPTPWSLLRRCTGRDAGRYSYRLDEKPIAADWVAGMFMLFQSARFRSSGGFDQGYYLYCEDIDLCARLWRAGHRVLLCPQAAVIHDARRESRRNLRFMRWHFESYARFFAKHGLKPSRGSNSAVDGSPNTQAAQTIGPEGGSGPRLGL